MKIAPKRIFSALLLTLCCYVWSAGTFAGDCVECGPKMEGVPKLPSDIEKVAAEVTIEVPTIADDRIQRLCSMARAQYVGGGKNKFKKALGMFLKVKEDDPLYKEKMSAFWKENMHRFICKYKKLGGREFPQMHIFKRLLYENHFQFFDNFLTDSKVVEIDFNYVEKRNGEEETIVDYLDKLIRTKKDDPLYSMQDLVEIRDMLVRSFDAKRAKDL